MSIENPQPALSLKTQLIRFVITGAFSAVIDLGVTLFLQNFLGIDSRIAKTAGFICGTTTAYLLNRRWTFKAAPNRKRFIAVAVLYLVTYGVQMAIFLVCIHWWGKETLATSIAFVIAQGTATVINFIVQRTIIFKLK